MNYRVHYFCKKCDKRITTDEATFSDCCPHCGYMDDVFSSFWWMTKVGCWVEDEDNRTWWEKFYKDHPGHWEYK